MAPNRCPLGSLVIELNQNSKQTPSMVLSMLRPVLDTLENRLDLEHTRSASPAVDDAGLELLLSVDEAGQLDSGALTHLLRHCMQHLGCVLGALLVPDKNLTVSCAVDESIAGATILDRTQKHLLGMGAAEQPADGRESRRGRRRCSAVQDSLVSDSRRA